MTDIDPSLPHYDVRVFISKREPGPEADKIVARLLNLPEGPRYTTDLNAIVSPLMALGYWWHLSHLEASVTLNRPVPGMEGLVSNAARHDREGRPISYKAIFSRDRPAWAVCEAWIKAVYDLPMAFAVQASHIEEVMSVKPRSRSQMMAYYKAREDLRQETIARIEKEMRSGRPPHR